MGRGAQVAETSTSSHLPTEGRRSRKGPLVGMVTAVAIAALLTGCGQAGTSASTTSTRPTVPAPTPTTSPALTQQVTYGGLSLQVPAGFTVRTFEGCPVVPDDTAWVGAFVAAPAGCTTAAAPVGAATGMSLSSAAVAASPGNAWQSVTTINGITVDSSEVPATLSGCGAGPCPKASELVVQFPSYKVGAVFVATGSVASTSLALAHAIVRTVAIHTTF